MSALFETWTLKQELPEPFAEIVRENGGKKTSVKEKNCSIYNTGKAKSAALHPPTLRAILWLADLMTGWNSGAAGFQAGDTEVNFYCVEYEKTDGKYALVYNSRNGKVKGLRLKDNTVEPLLPLSENGSDGEEYLALFAFISANGIGDLADREFASHFYDMLSHIEGENILSDEEFLSCAFVCCDNLYRRIEFGSVIGDGGIPLEESQLADPDFITPYLLNTGVYSPNAVEGGEFEILTVKTLHKEITLGALKGEFNQGRTYPEEYRRMIPNLPDYYRVNTETQEILSMIVNTPARFFMLAGESGAGKTTDSKIIAQALGYPHFVFTCGPNTEETSLMVSILPNIDSCKVPKEHWPNMEDFLMDPASAVAELTGMYPGNMESETAFRKILEEIYQRGYDRAKGEKDFIKKESTIIQACRMPSVIEIQEVSMIEKPGTLTRLNALFDDCAKTDLLNGEIIERHPDTVVILTTNLDYVGCQMFNESVLSRMNLIQHRKGMSAKDMAKRAVERTRCKEIEIVQEMARVVANIHQYLTKKQVQGGVCGYRELENWVWSYLATGDIVNASHHTVVSKASPYPEDREEILNTYILPYFEAAA